MKKILLMITVFIVVFSLTACKTPNDNSANVVYTTVYPVQFIAERLLGDTAEVHKVPGSQAHSSSYSWSASDLVEMINADLLFYIAGGADNYIPNNANAFVDGDVELIDISQHVQYNNICLEHSHEEENEASDQPSESCDEASQSPDPHFWLDPIRMATAAAFMRDKLIATFPENEQIINNNYIELKMSLEKLHEEYQKVADQATKPIITTVMLFEYWHDRYDIEIHSITRSVHTSDQDPADIIDIIVEATEYDIHYILFEKNSNSPTGDQALIELKNVFNDADALYVHGLGSLTLEETRNGANYLSIMYANLEILKIVTK